MEPVLVYHSLGKGVMAEEQFRGERYWIWFGSLKVRGWQEWSGMAEWGERAAVGAVRLLELEGQVLWISCGPRGCGVPELLSWKHGDHNPCGSWECFLQFLKTPWTRNQTCLWEADQETEDKNKAAFRMKVYRMKVNSLNILLIQMLWKEQKWLLLICCCIPWQIIFCLFLFQQFDSLTVNNVSLWQQGWKQSYAAHGGVSNILSWEFFLKAFWLI